MKIKLTKGEYAIIDDDDFEKISQFKWHFVGSGYKKYAMAHVRKNIFPDCRVKRTKRSEEYKKKNGDIVIYEWEDRSVYLHWLILSPPSGKEIDHINGNGLDNRKKNLRICTHQENSFNRRISKNNKCGYKGVRKKLNVEKWEAGIRINRKYIYLGLFKKPEQAAIAYNKAANYYFGEYARANFLWPYL